MPTAFETNTIVTLIPQSCGACGIVFGMPSDFRDARLADHESWYCPNGHKRHFTGKTEADKLRDQLASTRAHLDQAWARQSDLAKEAEHERRRVAGYKGAITRVRSRVAKGMCPCCSHEFKNLGAHMKTQHPDWNPDKHAEAIAAK